MILFKFSSCGHCELLQLASTVFRHIPIIVAICCCCCCFFEHFPTFWHYNRLILYIPYIFPVPVLKTAVSPFTSLFIRNKYMSAKYNHCYWGRLVSRSSQTEEGNMCVYIHLCIHTWLWIFLSVNLSMYIKLNTSGRLMSSSLIHYHMDHHRFFPLLISNLSL